MVDLNLFQAANTSSMKLTLYPNSIDIEVEQHLQLVHIGRYIVLRRGVGMETHDYAYKIGIGFCWFKGIPFIFQDSKHRL
jgi:hypothetical protein